MRSESSQAAQEDAPPTHVASLPIQVLAIPWITAALLVPSWFVIPQEQRPLAALWFFLASAAFLGMPHGALDLMRLWNRAAASTGTANPRRFLLLCGLYLVPVGIVAALWKLAPAATAFAFLALTIWHWGAGSLRFGETRSAAWARGVLVIAVPFLAHTEDALRYFDWMGAASPGLATTRWIAAALCASAWTAYCLDAPNEPNRTTTTGELALLTISGAVLSPLASIGLFFMFNHAWHAHVSWLSRCGRSPSARTALAGLAKLHGWPALAGTACMVSVIWIQPPSDAGASSSAATYLQLLAALTVPHAWLAWRESRAVVGNA